MGSDKIYVKGASQNNLKNIDVKIPRNNIVVVTGVSGSGKSSLALDTIYAEGQRQYVQSLSAYARQFLEQIDKPDVEYIEGLSPAISIEQKRLSRNPRSIVATVTEIYDYLRLLFARIGLPHCPQCGKEIKKQSAQEIVDHILEFEGEERSIISPIAKRKKGTFKKELETFLAQGFVKVRIDGEIRHLDEEDVELEEYRAHDIEIIVDTISVTRDSRERITDSVETALHLSNGWVIVSNEEENVYSESFSCPECVVFFENLEPNMFSFNSPTGACPECQGLGEKKSLDPDLVLDREKSILQGAIKPRIRPWSSGDQTTYSMTRIKQAMDFYSIPLDEPLTRLSLEQVNALLYGTEDRISFIFEQDGSHVVYTGRFEGVITNLERRYKETTSEAIRSEIEKFMSSLPCPVCKGDRLNPESLAVTVQGKSITDITKMSVVEAQIFFRNLNLSEREELISGKIIEEIGKRLGFMISVGLEYVTLDRRTSTLSVGEVQRIRLATQIGSSLKGILYILDEPSVGLHPRDTARLLIILKQLRDLGNTVIVIEHDEAIIKAADHIVDMGPGAGMQGGYIVAQGTVNEVCETSQSLTAKYLKRELTIPIPKKRRIPKEFLLLRGACHNNLKNIHARIPLRVFICITGVSGSGKSSLIVDTLYKALVQRFYRSTEKPGDYDTIEGTENIDKVVLIDQSPIGWTPRSNPAIYTNAFAPIRDIFSQLPESKRRGYKPGRFSFNVKGGRCSACEGHGFVKIDMSFLPDVYVPCEVCKGKRFNSETLTIRFKEKSIADILDMSVEEALTFFENIPSVRRRLETLNEVGLGYINLGQPATTLSGGEAQRVKLSRELSKKGTGNTLYILDEPTTGLHFEDVMRLLEVLRTLVERGNTVVVIEHNLDVIKTADYIIDLGPEGGEKGGYIVAEGPPESVAQTGTHTGKFLKQVLEEGEQNFGGNKASRERELS
jgi:excinuclease ABC subunit A